MLVCNHVNSVISHFCLITAKVLPEHFTASLCFKYTTCLWGYFVWCWIYYYLLLLLL